MRDQKVTKGQLDEWLAVPRTQAADICADSLTSPLTTNKAGRSPVARAPSGLPIGQVVQQLQKLQGKQCHTSTPSSQAHEHGYSGG